MVDTAVYNASTARFEPADNDPPTAAALADGSATPTAPTVGAATMLFNAAVGYERGRSNEDFTVLASAARTALVNSSDFTNRNARGVHIVINVTAIVSAPSLVFTVQGKDSVSSAYYTILVSAAIVGTGTTVLRIYPGLTAAANVTVSDVLPRQWRVSVAVGNANSITYSVGASLIV